VIAMLAPFQVYYSQEARMYILIALLASVSVLLFWWLLSQEDRRLPWNGGSSARPLAAVLRPVARAGVGRRALHALRVPADHRALHRGRMPLWLVVSSRGGLRWAACRALGLFLVVEPPGCTRPGLPTAIAAAHLMARALGTADLVSSARHRGDAGIRAVGRG
jgi:hypothetical protein